MCKRERDRKNGVRAELGFVRRAIKREHRGVGFPFVRRRTDQFPSDAAVHVRDRLQNTLAAVAFCVPVAQLERFMRPRGRAGRNRRRPHGAVGQPNRCLDSGVAA